MMRTTLACVALVGIFAGACKQTTSTPEKANPASAPATPGPGDEPPPVIEPSDDPVVPPMENDESAGVSDPPADDPEADESEHGDYE